ncbi:uncharacterized protein V6R79_018508 [Siganus canaliculatus]
MPKPVFKRKEVTLTSVTADSKLLVQLSATPVIGTIQIMVGVFNIGLGPGRTSISPGDLSSLGAAYWLGAVFIVTGIMSILAAEIPSTCLVGFTVFMNIVGAIFSVTGIALYAIDLINSSVLWICDRSENNADCQHLLMSVDVTMIALTVIQLIVSVRFAVVGIKALIGVTTEKQVSEMSVSVVKDKGVTVITVTSDTDSMLPPVCQVFKGLCYSPMLCSVKKGLMQSNAVSALAAVQIMVGLFNIGLAPGRISHHPGDFAHLGVAYWLGGVFVFTGVVSVFADQFSSLCLVGFAAFVNIVGAILSIVGIVMYAVDLGDHSIENMCDWGDERRYRDDNCRFVAYVGQDNSFFIPRKAGGYLCSTSPTPEWREV